MSEEIVIEEKKVSDDLKDISDDDLRELKAKGKIIYRLMKSKDGKFLRALDGTTYTYKGGALTKIGHINGQGEFVKLTKKISKRERSKIKRLEKRKGMNS